MRGPLALAIALFGGCYSPTITPGAPCDPAIGNCPRPLLCTASPTGFTCEQAGAVPDGAPMPDAATDGSADAAIDGPSIDAPVDAPAVTHVEYPSVVADCVDPADPDPDFCIARNGTGRIAVDSDDTSAGNAWDGYVRFDLDGTIAGRVVTSVRLRMTVSSDGTASSSSSGAIWQVGAFTRQSLFTAVPPVIGAAPLAGSQGPVAPGDDLLWTLPNSLPVANASMFLKVSTTDTDGTLYDNRTGTRPPRLIIDLQ